MGVQCLILPRRGLPLVFFENRLQSVLVLLISITRRVTRVIGSEAYRVKILIVTLADLLVRSRLLALRSLPSLALLDSSAPGPVSVVVVVLVVVLGV